MVAGIAVGPLLSSSREIPPARSRSGAADRARIFRFWTKIGAVVPLLIFLIGHYFPIAS
jgi:hypothetical protein